MRTRESGIHLMAKLLSIGIVLLLAVSILGFSQRVQAQAQPDFRISVSPTFQEVQAGQTTTFSVQVTPINGFSDSVKFDLSGLPKGGSSGSAQISWEFTPPSLTGSGVTTLKVTAPSDALQYWYTVTIIGRQYTVLSDGTRQYGNVQHNQRVTLVVDNPSLKIDLENQTIKDPIFGYTIIQDIFSWDHSSLNVKVVSSTESWFQQSYVDDVKNAIDQWTSSIHLYTGQYGDGYLRKISVCIFVQGVETNQCGNNFDVTISWVRIFDDCGFLGTAGECVRELGRFNEPWSIAQHLLHGCQFQASTIELAATEKLDEGDYFHLDDKTMANVAAHEFGHFLGLGHATEVPDDLMNGEEGHLPITTLDMVGLAVSWEWLREGTFKCPSTVTAHLPNVAFDGVEIPYEGMNIVIKVEPPQGKIGPPVGLSGDGIRFEMASHYGGKVAFDITTFSPDFKEMVSGGYLDVPPDGTLEVTFPTDLIGRPVCVFCSPPSTSSTGWYDAGLSVQTEISGIEWDSGFLSVFTILPPSTETAPPTIQSSTNLVPNSNGWNNAPVTVFWSVSDPDFGISSSSGCAATTLTSETAGTMLTCTATNAGGLSNSASVTVRIDMTPPTITGSRTPGPNANGWNNGPVTVSFTCTDALSGVDPTSVTQTIPLPSEVASQFVTGACKDNAGNSAFTTLGPISIDLSLPVVTGSRLPGPNENGWNNQDVTVLFSCTDSLSGVDIAPLSPQVVFTEAAGQSRTGTCIDLAGNSASAITSGINVDKTPPVITSAQDGQAFILRQAVFADARCDDVLSGVNTCILPAGALDTSTVGPHSYIVTSTDNAGNLATFTVQYDVHYAFTPISPKPASTRFQLGATIPVRFQLTDALGNFVSTATAQIWVDSPTNPGGSSGSANLGNYCRYDLMDNQYVFNLSTRGMTTGLHTIYITVDDGTVHTLSVTLSS